METLQIPYRGYLIGLSTPRNRINQITLCIKYADDDGHLAYCVSRAG